MGQFLRSEAQLLTCPHMKNRSMTTVRWKSNKTHTCVSNVHKMKEMFFICPANTRSTVWNVAKKLQSAHCVSTKFRKRSRSLSETTCFNISLTLNDFIVYTEYFWRDKWKGCVKIAKNWLNLVNNKSQFKISIIKENGKQMIFKVSNRKEVKQV